MVMTVGLLGIRTGAASDNHASLLKLLFCSRVPIVYGLIRRSNGKLPRVGLKHGAVA